MKEKSSRVLGDRNDKTDSTKDIKQTKKVSKRMALFLFLILFVAAVVLLVYINAGLFLVALVNNRPIWRVDLIRQLEKQAGKQVAETLVNKSLVYQESLKRNVSVSDQEVNGEYSKLEEQFKSQGMSLQDAMALQGLTENSLKEEIRFNLLLKKLLENRVSVSDEEVKDYFDKNKEMLGGSKSFDELKGQIREFLTSQKMSQSYQSFIDELKSSYNVKYFMKFN